MANAATIRPLPQKPTLDPGPLLLQANQFKMTQILQEKQPGMQLLQLGVLIKTLIRTGETGGNMTFMPPSLTAYMATAPLPQRTKKVNKTL